MAVHGLNFKNDPDHARDTWKRDDSLWLKDFLPGKLAKPVRVMLFSYNSSPAIDAAAIKLDDHAKNLLQWLDIERQVSLAYISSERWVLTKITQGTAKAPHIYLSQPWRLSG